MLQGCGKGTAKKRTYWGSLKIVKANRLQAYHKIFIFE